MTKTVRQKTYMKYLKYVGVTTPSKLEQSNVVLVGTGVYQYTSVWVDLYVINCIEAIFVFQ